MSASVPVVTEGEAIFSVPGVDTPCKTWYRVYGDLTTSSQTPVIILHGGPGCCHDYLLPLTDLTTQHGTPTIFYDQLGNGRSTHLPQRKGDVAFWTPQLFKDELDNLVDHLALRARGFALLGHSWGGMLAAMYAVDHGAPHGLQRIVVSNSPASMDLWSAAARRLRRGMPTVDAVLSRCEAENRLEGDHEYDAAAREFYKRHVCRVWPWPAEMEVALRRIEEDPTTYHTMNGPNEFYVIGNLKGWSIVRDLSRVEVPALLLNGEFDEAADSTVRPYFEGIRKVRWRTLAGCSHMAFLEDRAAYMETVAGFLG